LHVGPDVIRHNLKGDWIEIPPEYLIRVTSNPNEVRIYKNKKYDTFLRMEFSGIIEI
jgi:hypothetical protein